MVAATVNAFLDSLRDRRKLLQISLLHIAAGHHKRQFLQRDSHRKPVTYFVLSEAGNRSLSILLPHHQASLLQLNKSAANSGLADLEHFGETEFAKLFSGLESAGKDRVLQAVEYLLRKRVRVDRFYGV